MVRLRTILLAALVLSALAPSLAQGPAPPQLWKRQGGVLSPRRAGDSVAIGTTVLSPTLGVIVPVVVALTSPAAPTATGYYLNNTAGAITYNLPVITPSTVGMQMCFRNAVNRMGAITLQAPADTYIDLDGGNGSAAGTLVSSGAPGDAACVLAVSTTQYMATVGSGMWSNN